MPIKTLERRLTEGMRLGEGGCWEWTRGKTSAGYGVIGFEGAKHLCHRLVYEIFIGPIPAGLEIDHLCRNRACVRPDHLEAVTHRENTLRGKTIAAMHAAKTHCVNGHEFTPENIYRASDGTRQCRACRARRMREFEARHPGRWRSSKR